MARDFNARAAAAQAKKENDRNERYEALETDVIGLTDDILAITFPEKDNGDADWDKFNWNRAEQLKQLLKQFHEGNAQPTAPTSQPADQSATRQPRGQRQTTPAPAATPDPTPVATPPASTPSPAAPPKKGVKGFAAKVWSGN